MAADILVALFTALASATSILLVLRTVLKVFDPKAFGERIPKPDVLPPQVAGPFIVQTPSATPMPYNTYLTTQEALSGVRFVVKVRRRTATGAAESLVFEPLTQTSGQHRSGQKPTQGGEEEVASALVGNSQETAWN